MRDVRLINLKKYEENIDTGAMYRCVSLDMIRKNIKLNEQNNLNGKTDKRSRGEISPG